MKPETSTAIRRLHGLLQQVAAEVAAIRPLLEEEFDLRDAISEVLNKRLDADPPGRPTTGAADLQASRNTDLWVDELQEATEKLNEIGKNADCLIFMTEQADLSAWMLANRSTVFDLSSDDDSRVCALVDAARNALPDAPRYALDATARAVLALPADVAYPVQG